MYLLDTNACIRLLNNTSAPLVERLRRHSPHEITLCAVVKAELLYGAQRSSRVADNIRVLEQFFAPFASLPFDDRCAEVFGRIRAELSRNGQPIGPYDMQIAAITIVHNCILVTANVGEFSRVVGLRLENWEEEP